MWELKEYGAPPNTYYLDNGNVHINVGSNKQAGVLFASAEGLLEIAKEMKHRLADEIGVPVNECVGGFFKRWNEIIIKAEVK